MSFGSRLVTAALLAGMAMAAPISQASAAYPEKTITFVIPFAPGGGTDRWGRLLAAEAERHFGKPWQPANVTGAQGITGWKHMLGQPADGHTLIMGSGTINLSLALNPTPVVKDSEIKIISIISDFQSMFVVKPGQPWSTWEGLKKYAAANPNKLVLGGSLGNLVALASLVQQANVPIKLVPYPGAGQATTDFLGGHIHAMGVPPSVADKLVPDKAVAIVVGSDDPVKSAKLKDVPTAKTVGLQGMSIPRWIGVHPDTPDALADAIATKLKSLLDDPKVKEPLEKTGEDVYFTPRVQSQQQYDRMVVTLRKTSALLK